MNKFRLEAVLSQISTLFIISLIMYVNIQQVGVLARYGRYYRMLRYFRGFHFDKIKIL